MAEVLEPEARALVRERHGDDVVAACERWLDEWAPQAESRVVNGNLVLDEAAWEHVWRVLLAHLDAGRRIPW
jgi:hypothetical protein